MYGTAVVLVDERFDVLTIPATALVWRGGKTEVFHVADVTGDPPRGVVRRAEVELGMDDGRRVEIRKGLSGNEYVIAKGNGVVREGDTVLVVPGRNP
jgi:multidrug efflux pump subunit AcrA (membrane-fusion protein)